MLALRGLCFLVLLAAISMTAQVAAAMPYRDVRTFDAPTYSVSRPMIDFYAKGTNLPNRLEISPSGGMVQIGSRRLSVIPWEYIETTWRGEPMWVIMLANVTATDFTIMYVYLSNSPTPFYLRSYTYSEGKFKTYTFSGFQYVRQNVVTTDSVQMPEIQFLEKSKSKSKFAALGSDLYLNGESGIIASGTDTLAVYPLYSQLATASNAYNEVWILARDSSGGRWFSILYFTSSDPDHVIMAHTARLDDLQTAPIRTLNAKWKQGQFTVKLKVYSTIPESTIRIDGFPFTSDSLGIVNVLVPPGNHEVGVEPIVYDGESVRSSFKNWSDGNTDNPRMVEIRSDTVLSAEYEREFNLKVVSQLNIPDVGGWYRNGTLVTFSVPTVYDAQNGTRFILASWSADLSPSFENGTVLMDASKVLVFEWKRQYLLTFNVEGTPQTSELTFRVNAETHKFGAGNPVQFWADSESVVTYDVSPVEFKVDKTKYLFVGWNSTVGSATGTLTATRPTTLTASYRAITETSMTVQVQPTLRFSDAPFRISGSVTNINEAVTVNLYYGTDGSQWQLIGSVRTDPSGAFSYDWYPPSEFTLFVKGTWAGDMSHEGSSSNVVVVLNLVK